ncbi:MAG TPA: NAD(P)H-quinone oxidoreductase [Bacillota bacterium]
MRAVITRGHGGPEVLELGTHPDPEPADDELLVRVRATALNRADLLQREGRYPPPPGASPILGLELAGVVERVGSRCPGFRQGDRVCALLPGGGYAEYAAVPHDLVMRVPDNLSFEEAAAIPEVFLTAYLNLVWLGRLAAAEHALIHAGASGVGTAAIQLVREWGARPLATAGSDDKVDLCRQLGAEAAFNYRAGPWDAAVIEATGGRGVDVILDPVGAPYWDQNLRALAPDGRLIFIAMMGGTRLPEARLGPILSKRLQVMGSTLRGRSREFKARLIAEFAGFALPRLRDGRLRPVIDRIYDWTEVADAHAYMQSNRNKGKIVLRVT